MSKIQNLHAQGFQYDDNFRSLYRNLAFISEVEGLIVSVSDDWWDRNNNKVGDFRASLQE